MPKSCLNNGAPQGGDDEKRGSGLEGGNVIQDFTHTPVRLIAGIFLSRQTTHECSVDTIL